MKIKYVGLKDEETAFSPETGIVWYPGSAHDVPDAIGKRMLAHPDVFALAAAVTSPAPPPAVSLAQDVLYGTDVLGGTIILSDDVSVSLGAVVAQAHKESGLSVQAWNALSQPERDKLILDLVSRAKAEVTQGSGASAGSTGEQGGEGGQGDKPVTYRMASENGPLDLTSLDKDTLRRLAKSVNLSVSNNAGEDTLRRKLAEAFPVA